MKKKRTEEHKEKMKIKAIKRDIMHQEVKRIRAEQNDYSADLTFTTR